MALAVASVSPRYGAVDSPSRMLKRASGMREASSRAMLIGSQGISLRWSTRVETFSFGSSSVTSKVPIALRAARAASGLTLSRKR
jgi:hypothetical protein